MSDWEAAFDEWVDMAQRLPDHWMVKRWPVERVCSMTDDGRETFILLLSQMDEHRHPVVRQELARKVDRLLDLSRVDAAHDAVRVGRAKNVTPQTGGVERVRPLPQGFDEAKYLKSVRGLQKHERQWDAVCTRLYVDHGITVSRRRLPEWVRVIGAPRPWEVAD